jgi:hypothetical protein
MQHFQLPHALVKKIRKSRYGRIANIPRRLGQALRGSTPAVIEAFRWTFVSREDTNYTYRLKEQNVLYLAHILSYISGAPFAEVTHYIDEARLDEELSGHVARLVRSGPYRSYADPRCDFARRLGWYALVRIMRPNVVVETGVDKGLGSVLLCAALLRNGTGRYYGTDINPAAGYFLRDKYAAVGEILYGDSIASLRKLISPIDFFINDSDHSADYELEEYNVILDKLTAGAIVIGDNAHVSTKLAEWSVATNRDFLYWREEPAGHWYQGGGIGLSLPRGLSARNRK